VHKNNLPEADNELPNYLYMQDSTLTLKRGINTIL